MNRFLSFVDGVKNLIEAIKFSTGSGDADKIISTDSTGKIDNSFLKEDIAKIPDINNKQRYGKFLGLSSDFYLLGADLSIVPVVGGQSGIQSYWGLQLGGLRPDNMYTPSFAAKNPPEISGILSADSFVVGIKASINNPNDIYIFNGAGQTKPLTILGVYGTSWHYNGWFIECQDTNFVTKFAIGLDGNVYINYNKVLGDRDLGWTSATGTALKGTFDTTTATVQNCAERIKALEDMLRTHGLIN